MNTSGRQFLKNTQVLKKPKSRSKINDEWRTQSQPTMPQVKATIRRMITNKQEIKFFDTLETAVAHTSGGNVIHLSNIPVGNSDSTRIGDSVLPQRLECRFNWLCGDATQYCRLIIFRWKPFFGSTSPSTSSILFSSVAANIIVSPFVHDQRDQFEVLLDKTTIPLQSGVSGQINSNTVIVNMKMARKPIQWVTGSTTNMSNGIFALMVSDSAVVPNPTITSYFRLTYTDS
jgi:hypothetical protein